MNIKDYTKDVKKTVESVNRQELLVMDMGAFAEAVKQRLEEEYPSAEVEVQEEAKNNGRKRTSISVWEDGCNGAPIIYLENLYQQHLAGKSLAQICQIITEIHKRRKHDKEIGISRFAQFSVARERICYKLVNAEKNAALLQEVPHRLWNDLAVIYYILVAKDSEKVSSFLIKNELVTYWHVDEDTLYETAGENTKAFFRAEIQPMEKMLCQAWKESFNLSKEELFTLADFIEMGLPFYVVSNDCHVQGAITMLYEGMMQKFARKINGDFYILPLSIHETIWISKLPGMDADILLNIVQGTNAGYVAPEEFLSDNVYRYHAEEGCVRVVE